MHDQIPEKALTWAQDGRGSLGHRCWGLHRWGCAGGASVFNRAHTARTGSEPVGGFFATVGEGLAAL